MQKNKISISKRYRLDKTYEVYIEHIRGIHHDMTSGIQIIYVIKGKVRLGSKIFSQGDIFLINTNELKFIYNCQIGSYICVLNIDDEFLQKELGESPRVLYKNDLNKIPLVQTIKSLMLSIYKLALDNLEDISIKINLKRMVTVLKENYNLKDNLLKVSDSHFDYLKEMKNYIETNDPKMFNLDNIAKDIYISPSYASTIFKNVTSVSFSEFLQQYLLYLSTRELIEGNLNIDDISSKVGFRSSKSLNLIFNRYLKITPSKFRNVYRNINEENDYLDAFNILSRLDLDRYEEIYREEELNFHQISLNKKVNKKNKLDIVMDVKNFGNNYITNLKRVLQKINLKELIIPIDLKDDFMLITNLNLEISFNDLRDLLNILSINNITPIFKIKAEEIDFKNKSFREVEEKMSTNLQKLSDLYKLISDIVGVSKMKEYKYFLNVGVLNNYIYNKKELNLYRKYLINKQRLLEEILGTKDYLWGYEIGKITDKKLENLIRIYRDFKPSKFKPSYLSIDCTMEEMAIINTIEDGKVVIDKIKEKVDLIERSLEFINDDFDKIYIQDLFKNIDVTKLPDDYKDLFTILLTNEARFFSASKYEYTLDYTMLDSRSKDGYYYPKLINDYGFHTSIYWACSLMNEFRGDLVYWGHNLIVRKDDEDIYVLFLGSGIIDMIFAKSHNFKMLETYKNNVDIIIDGMSGRYKKTEQTLEYRRSSAEYYLKDYKNYRYLTYDEIKKIEKISGPKFNIEILDVKGRLEDKISHTPFNMVLQIYRKIL